MDFFEISRNKPTKSLPPGVVNGNSNHSDSHTVYKDIRVGEMIKVVCMEGGLYNCYKGYIGEVKDYKRGQDSAVVILHAMNYPKMLRMPLEHFIKLH